MSRVAFTELAENDLTDIWLYIAEDNPDAADRFIDRIYDTCHKTLVPSPESGRARPELADSLRSFPVGNYVIFYRPSRQGVQIVRVLSGHRDIPALFHDR